ncbi:sphingomyelin phosphodiesterase 2 [Trichonephila clavipes]|nr:sphingomyelin phosphodiesterase 2 [Trichonephila clavipes]
MEAIASHIASSEYDFVFLQEIWSQKDFQMICKKAASVLPYSYYFHSGVLGSGVCISSKKRVYWPLEKTATAGLDVVQSGRPIFDYFFQHLWPYIGNNTANVVFQMVKRLWLIRIDQ